MMKADTHVLAVVAIFATGIVIASAVGGWQSMMAQSVTGMRGEDGSAYGGVPQADPAGSTNRAPSAASSANSSMDDTVPPRVGESASSAESTGEEDREWSDGESVLDDPPPDPTPTKIPPPPPPPPIQEIQPSDSDGNWPNGINGINWPHGINGINGINWPNGINGINGLNGLNGINGINGLNGLNGINGVNAVRNNAPSQVSGASDRKVPPHPSQKRKSWWKDLERGPAPLETVVPDAWQKVPGEGAKAEPEGSDEGWGLWPSFRDATEFSDDEDVAEEDGVGEGDEEDVALSAAPGVSATVLTWVRDAVEEVGGAITAFFSNLFGY